MPGPNVPFPPMEAQLVEKLPEGERWQYEPKWDGFRGVLENDGGELALWSRNERPLLRYFPELRKLGDLLPPHSALDGEIVIELDGRLEFDAMQMRLHPAESRIRKLSAETPARYIAFDILLWNGEPIHERPLAERRKELERVAKGFSLSPVSKDPALAQQWLERLEIIGLDGVIAKRVDLPYKPGARDAVSKVKHHRTCDCVIVGYRTSFRRSSKKTSTSTKTGDARPRAAHAGRRARTCRGTRSGRRSSARYVSTRWSRSGSATAPASSAFARTRSRSSAPGSR